MKPFDGSLIWGYIVQILPFLSVTGELLGLSLLFGMLLGLLIAKGKLSKSRVARKICFGYTTVIRCSPTLVLMFLVYYGIPRFLKLFNFDGRELGIMFYVVIAFSLISAAELSEVFRSAYEAVPKGQREAGISIGMTELQTFWRITLPQALKVAVPNLGNTVILLFKEGSIAYTIGLIDIMGKANLINETTWGVHAMEVFIAVSLIYWAISIIFEQAIHLYEVKVLNRSSGRQPSAKRSKKRSAAVHPKAEEVH